MKRGNELLRRAIKLLAPAELAAYGVPMYDHCKLKDFVASEYAQGAFFTQRRRAGSPGCPGLSAAALAVLIAASSHKREAGSQNWKADVARRFDVSEEMVANAPEKLRIALRKRSLEAGADVLDDRRKQLIVEATHVIRELTFGAKNTPLFLPPAQLIRRTSI